ncbi:hypothetical protein CBS147326_9552 [Penicillium roqueforti]|nr:hypothetical protein CBS147326_9552 [Penicillium roqueforti]
MERSPAPIDSSSDDEFVVAPPFTAIGRSIPSMSWLNKQLESSGDRPGMRGEEQNLKSEQPHGTRDALSQASSRSEALSYTVSRGYKLQPARLAGMEYAPHSLWALGSYGVWRSVVAGGRSDGT